MMGDRLMVSGLRHEWSASSADFLQAIDASGGWPLGYKYAGFEHSNERAAGFCNSPHNDGWWTVVASSDDYYLWKLSPEALQRVVNAAMDSIRLQKPDATKLFIRDSRGHKAATATP